MITVVDSIHGCTDVDHVTLFPDGPTAVWKLQCLCRHHRAKHETGWKVTMTRTGVCTWTSPLRTRTRHLARRLTR
ncbi:hypothetical protein [Flexivirga caeni]|uniref:hypothetical protein n=1 Tax=Flexivirga caeni TaxID=2294115 RepID=UPI0011CD5B00|nr:hypothetical protein [Flexivirga caeni]